MKVKIIGKNQIEIETEKATILQSYNTIVAAKIAGKCYKTDRYHSKTTSKHINAFLNGSVPEEKSQDFFDKLME